MFLRRESHRHGNVRAEAVAAGLDMVATDGHAALSLRRIAERVGVAHCSLYNHFANREALLDVLAERPISASAPRCGMRATPAEQAARLPPQPGPAHAPDPAAITPNIMIPPTQGLQH